jgi:hypothetical protein
MNFIKGGAAFGCSAFFRSEPRRHEADSAFIFNANSVAEGIS